MFELQGMQGYSALHRRIYLFCILRWGLTLELRLATESQLFSCFSLPGLGIFFLFLNSSVFF